MNVFNSILNVYVGAILSSVHLSVSLLVRIYDCMSLDLLTRLSIRLSICRSSVYQSASIIVTKNPDIEYTERN